MHAIEKELIKVTGYKARQKFNDRQDYLGSILNAAIKMTDDDFENISDEAAGWVNSAIAAKNAKDEELPDFDETEPAEEDDEADTEEAESEGEAVDDADEDAGEEAEADAEADEEAEAEDEVAEDEPEPEPEPVKKRRKPAKVEKKPAPVAVKPKGKPPQFDEDVVLDKWGCMEGSKNAQALALFEKGATAREVKEKLGGTYYNILGKMAEKGHKLEKEGALIKLTHSSEGAKPKPAVKGKKK